MTEGVAWRISRLAKTHIRTGFSCGEPALDLYLRRFARQNDAKGLTRTYVATRRDELEVGGYVTIRAGAVACSDLQPTERKRLPRYPVPVVHVARLAVDHRSRGQGLGELLLMHALATALDVAEDVGIRAVEVLAKNAGARAFYERYGFTSLIDDPLHLYLPIDEARRAFA